MAEQNEEWGPDKVQRFQEQRRCMGCKKRCQGEMITCEKCLEFQYCNIHCLEAHREEHRPICGVIGVKKGRLHVHVGKDKDRLEDIRQRARSLDDEGNMKTLENMFQSQSLEPDSNLPGSGENVPKGDNSGNIGVKKKKRSKKKNAKKRGNGSNNSNNNSNNKNSNSKSESSVDSKIAGGQFGGPRRCNEEVKSGVKFGEGWWKAAPNMASKESGNSSSISGTHTEIRFGEGWWKQEPKNSGASASTSGAKSEVKDHESGSRTKPKFSDMYADSDDEEPRTIRRERSEGGNGATEASRPSPSSSSASASASAYVTGASAAESASGLEVVSYDAEAAEEQVRRYQAEGGNSSKLGKCDFCDTSGFVLTCGRCKEATYCDKSCQKQHFPDHKEACKRIEKFKKALAKTKMTRGLLAMFGCRTAGTVSPSLTDLADPLEYMLVGATHAIMLEIIGPHPHLFRHGAFLRDIRGQVTQILFYDQRNFYTDISSGMLGMLNPIPLSECLRPGNFILLLDSHWHHFLDGTVGIRIDDIDTVQFIFMDK